MLANARHAPNATSPGTRSAKPRAAAAHNVVHPRRSALASVHPLQAAMSALVNAAVAQAPAQRHAVRDREEHTRSVRHAIAMNGPVVRADPVASAQARAQKVAANGREPAAQGREVLVPNGARAAKGNAPSAKDAANDRQGNALGHRRNVRAMPPSNVLRDADPIA